MANQPAHYQPVTDEYAVVTEVQHPLVKLEGFSTVIPGEVLQFANNSLGQVIQFSGNTITAQTFATTAAGVGSKVLRTNQELSIPLSQEMLGYIFDPLGNPVDSASGNRQPNTTEMRPVDVTPPALINREQITQQLVTGLTVVDELLPIGKGQRQLIIGDQHTGKESVLLNSALTQAKQDAVIVYALIGKTKAEMQRLKHFFSQHQILNKLVMITSHPNDAVSTIAATPFTAMTVAEYFRDLGRDVLIILDDLSKHAKFYRELSLLARKFPGRDSYPGDIFYTHARLLERAGCFSFPQAEGDQPEGKTAITCLPVAKTVGSDVTDYIVSNLISITDGHLLFDPHLFAEGQRPAINTPLSVTRVGKQTQNKLGRDINRVLTSFMSSYYKTVGLTQFGSELSNESQAILERGKQLLALFAQPNITPLPVPVQQVLIGMVWHDWFAAGDNQEEAVGQRITSAKQALLQAFSNDANKQTLLQLTKAEDFDSFLNELKNNKAKILELCKL